MTNQGHEASSRAKTAPPRREPSQTAGQAPTESDRRSAQRACRGADRGVSRRMSPFEASLHSQVKRALIERDVGAMVRIITLCERYGILEMLPEPPLRGGLLIIPKSWREEEWRAMFKKHGPPPWPGPRSGLPGDPPKDRDDRGG